MTFLLDLGDGGPLIPCRDERQALALGRLYVALRTRRPAETADPSDPAAAPTASARAVRDARKARRDSHGAGSRWVVQATLAADPVRIGNAQQARVGREVQSMRSGTTRGNWFASTLSRRRSAHMTSPMYERRRRSTTGSARAGGGHRRPSTTSGPPRTYRRCGGLMCSTAVGDAAAGGGRVPLQGAERYMG